MANGGVSLTSLLASGVGRPISERTRTLVGNAHGTWIELREPVLLSQAVQIKNLGTNEEMSGRVVDI